MKKTIVSAFRFSSLAAIVLALLVSQAARAAGDEKEAVKAAQAQFYSALNKMFTGDVAPMKKVWAHTKDVTYMGPGGGIQTGWDKVLKEWEKQAAMKLGGTVKPTKASIVIGKDLAVLQNYEVGKNTNAAGKTEKISIRATNVFRNTSGGWKMISHHTDLIPYLEKK